MRKAILILFILFITLFRSETAKSTFSICAIDPVTGEVGSAGASCIANCLNGMVVLIGGGRTAAYTGVNCTNYKNHITGPTYTIQGNILHGQKVLDSIKQAIFSKSQKKC